MRRQPPRWSLVSVAPGSRPSVSASRPRVGGLDVDSFGGELASVVSPRRDHSAFWRTLMRVAHETGRNGLPVVCCGVMLPEQPLENRGLLGSSALFVSWSCRVRRCGARADGTLARERLPLRARRSPFRAEQEAPLDRRNARERRIGRRVGTSARRRDQDERLDSTGDNGSYLRLGVPPGAVEV